jgi:hypothetical protein
MKLHSLSGPDLQLSTISCGLGDLLSLPQDKSVRLTTPEVKWIETGEEI